MGDPGMAPTLALARDGCKARAMPQARFEALATARVMQPSARGRLG